MTAGVLPTPTTDLEAALADFTEHGYCLVADALDAGQLGDVRARLVAVAADERDRGAAYIDAGGSNQRVWNLINRGREFVDLAAHPLALELMDRILGGHPQYGLADDLPAYLLGSITANIAGPGGDAMALHADQGYVPFPWPPFPLVCNIAWLLDDVTEANGATRIVPGTQLHQRVPDPDAAQHAIPAEAPAGTALVFDGRLWHGTGRNITESERRHVILAYYCKPWIRQQENFTTSVRREVLETMTPVVRRLLGFDHYGSLGMIDGVTSTAQLFSTALTDLRKLDR